MTFDDGGEHVVEYAIAGDVFVKNGTQLKLVSGSSIENSLYVGDRGYDNCVVLDGGFNSVVKLALDRADKGVDGW